MTDVRVEGHTVLASGIHAVLNVGGIVLRTRGGMRGVAIEFLDSRNPAPGQITISTLPGDTVEARIAGNRIHGGAGYGILCGGGTDLLPDLPANDFLDNGAGDNLGLPLREHACEWPCCCPSACAATCENAPGVSPTA